MGNVASDTQNLKNAFVRLSGATLAEPKVLELGAGRFRVDDANELEVPRFVSLVGQGQNATILQSQVGIDFSGGSLRDLTIIGANGANIDTLLNISCNGDSIRVNNINIQSGAQIAESLVEIEGPCNLTNDQVSFSGMRINHQANTPGISGISMENDPGAGVPNFRISDVFIRVQVDGNGASVNIFDIDTNNAPVVLNDIQALGAPGTVGINHESSGGLTINGLQQRIGSGASVTGPATNTIIFASRIVRPTATVVCHGASDISGTALNQSCQ